MANYMAEVAKMLGVEFGEEFEVGSARCTYFLTDDGLFYKADYKRCDHVLMNILQGKTEIYKRPWKPQEHDFYYFINKYGIVTRSCRGACETLAPTLYKLGNCYKTKEEAEANREKWASFYASDEVLEV